MPRTPTTRICAVDGCTERGATRGMCKRHYDQERRRGLPRCSFDGCTAAATLSTGLCQSCTKRLERNGTLDRRKKAQRIDRRGYVAVWAPEHPMATTQGWVLEHRMVAYDAGLLTDRSDHVHHINHDKRDNRIENLEVLSPLDHARLHGGEWEVIDPDEARRLYVDELWSTVELAEYYGVNSATISRSLRRNGIPTRTAGETRELRNRLTRSRPGWFFTAKTTAAHYGLDGANEGWLSACGLVHSHPGAISSAKGDAKCSRCARVVGWIEQRRDGAA